MISIKIDYVMNLIISLESGEGESNARPIDLQSIALPSELSPVQTKNLSYSLLKNIIKTLTILFLIVL